MSLYHGILWASVGWIRTQYALLVVSKHLSLWGTVAYGPSWFPPSSPSRRFSLPFNLRLLRNAAAVPPKRVPPKAKSNKCSHPSFQPPKNSLPPILGVVRLTGSDRWHLMVCYVRRIKRESEISWLQGIWKVSSLPSVSPAQVCGTIGG